MEIWNGADGKRTGSLFYSRLAGALMCVICVVLSGSGALAAGEDNWTNQVVVGSDVDAYFLAMALDGSGNPGMAYHSSTGTMFSFLEGGVWNQETIDSDVTDGGVGVAWDGSTWLVAYGHGNLMFAKRDPATDSWSKKTIDKTNVYVGQYGIDVYTADNNYRIGISYQKGGLKYAEYSDGSWTTTTIVKSIETGWSEVRFDSNGEPSIAYQQRTKGRGALSSTYYLHFAERSSGKWSTSTIASGSDKYYGLDIGMELDSNDNPYIVDMAYLYYNTGSGWTKETVAGFTEATSLALDETGGTVVPYVAYLDSSYDIAISRKVDGQWVRESIDSTLNPQDAVLAFRFEVDANNEITAKGLVAGFTHMKNPTFALYCAERDLLNPTTWG